MRLKWQGSLEAQKQHDLAYQALKPKNHKKTKVKKRHRKQHRKHKTNHITNNKDYKSYIRSQKWRELRKEVLKVTDGKCAKCGSASELHIHHLTYRRLFSERLDDLTVLCKECHEKHHGRKFLADRY